MKKKKKQNLWWPLLVVIGLLVLACGKEDPPPVDPVDDGGVTDDDGGGAVGFQGDIDWIKALGGSQIDEGVAIVRADGGGYVVLGTTYSNDGDIIDKNTTDADFWVLKLSETGEILWNRTYGGSNDDVATKISKTNDGGYIVSGYSRSDDGDVTGNAGFHDYWILKLNASGGKMWNKTFGFLGSDQALDVFQTSDGGYLATGFFDVTASGGAGNDGRSSGKRHGVGEYWIIKMDATGEYTWRRYYGGTNNDRSYDALETSDGGFLIAGSSESDDFDITDSKGTYDYWVVKINAQGNKQWTRSFGGSEIDNGYAVTTAADGSFVFVGDSRSVDKDVTNPIGNADMWVVKFGPAGGIQWNKSLGGSQFESGRSIETLNDGRLLISGSTRSTDGDVAANNGENDAWVVMLSNTGTVLFERTIGGSNFDFGEDAILGNDGSAIVMVGNTESNDKDIPGNKGIKDLLVVKLK